jgi:hypothetical protein
MSVIEKPGWFGRELLALAIVALAAAPPLSTYIATQSWERVKAKPVERTIRVTGSAKRRIVSDLIEWNATVTAEGKDKLGAYRALHVGVEKTVEYLKAQGVGAGDIFPDSAIVEEQYTTVYEGKGEDRISKEVLVGYVARQAVTVRSADVQRIERMSREVTNLLEQGVSVTSQQPAYFYTKLGELKVEMLSEASRDARTRAENMLKAAGGASLGRLKDADMGVININPANVTRTSWEGNNDTSSLDKDIIAIVHVTYALR